MNPFQLPSVSLAEKDKLPSAPGIYYVLNRHSNEIVYVGRSKNIRSRWKEHHWDWNIKAMEAVLYEQSVMVIAWEICPIPQLNELENERIKTLKPRLNGLSTEKFTQDFEIEFQLEDCPKYNRYFFDSIPPGDKISARVINYFQAKANLVELFNYQHPKLNTWVPRFRHFELAYLLNCAIGLNSSSENIERYRNSFYELVNNDIRDIMMFYNSSPDKKYEKLQGTNWEGYAFSNVFAAAYSSPKSVMRNNHR